MLLNTLNFKNIHECQRKLLEKLLKKKEITRYMPWNFLSFIQKNSEYSVVSRLAVYTILQPLSRNILSSDFVNSKYLRGKMLFQQT